MYCNIPRYLVRLRSETDCFKPEAKGTSSTTDLVLEPRQTPLMLHE